MSRLRNAALLAIMFALSATIGPTPRTAQVFAVPAAAPGRSGAPVASGASGAPRMAGPVTPTPPAMRPTTVARRVASRPSGELASARPAGIPTRTYRGTATWFATGGPGLYAAAHGYVDGTNVHVRVCHAATCLTLALRTQCAACRWRNGAILVDLSATAFRRLAPLSVGVVAVTVTR